MVRFMKVNLKRISFMVKEFIVLLSLNMKVNGSKGLCRELAIVNGMIRKNKLVQLIMGNI